jgi:hypothetical protein
MSRWFRHYAGMMRDDKLVRVAIRSKQTIERVVWIYGAILESAAEIDDGGRYDLDTAEVAYFLRADEADVDAVLVALADAGRLAENGVVKWGNRQFQSDRSKDRVAAYRERKRAEGSDCNRQNDAGNSGVTLQVVTCNAPETETELKTETPPVVPRKRGSGKTPLPEDWAVPSVPDLTPKAKACAERWTRESYDTVAEQFVCFWRRTGRMNKDWRLTWCEWVIKENAKVLRDQKFGNAAPAESREVTAAEYRDRAERFDRMGRRDDAAECRQKAAAIEQRAAA